VHTSEVVVLTSRLFFFLIRRFLSGNSHIGELVDDRTQMIIADLILVQAINDVIDLLPGTMRESLHFFSIVPTSDALVDADKDQLPSASTRQS
jgi:hypothetical protein